MELPLMGVFLDLNAFITLYVNVTPCCSKRQLGHVSLYELNIYTIYHTMRFEQNGRHFANDKFKFIFLKENVEI